MIDWVAFWENRKTEGYEFSGYSNWMNSEEYIKKLTNVSEFLETVIDRNNDKVVNVGAGSAYLEKIFNPNFDNWYCVDANKKACKNSGGIVNLKTVGHPKELICWGDTLLMVSVSQYFRESIIYDCTSYYKKIIIVDAIIKEDPLSMSTMGENHSCISLSNIIRLCKDFTLSTINLVPFRSTLVVNCL